MNKFLVVLGTLLAASSGWIFYQGRQAAAPRKPAVVPAKKAAELLAQAWSDHHTRA